MKRARRLWLNLHLGIGLALGSVFALLGVTGSLLVFYPEIDRALNPALQPSAPVATVSVQAIADKVKALYPERNGGWRIELPLSENAPVTVRYAPASERTGRSFSPLMITLDPATLQATSQRVWGDYAVTWVYDLHYTLLFDKAGKTAVGIVGLVMLASLVSGLWLWWPSGKRWRAALRPQLREGAVRRTYDLHALGGAYGAVLLIVLALTGAGLALPEQTRSVISAAARIKPMPDVGGPAWRGEVALDLDDAVAIARERFPQAELRWVDIPAADRSVLALRFYQPGEPGRRFPKTKLWMDAYTGEVLQVWDPTENAAGNVMLDWLHPLHNGEAFGLAGRWLAFFSGLVPVLLFVTGFIRWRQKRNASVKSEAKRCVS